MGLLADHQIKKRIGITPFEDHRLQHCGLTHGVSSYGYDARVGRDFKVFTNVHTAIIDPKNFDNKSFVDFKDVDYCIIPPNSFALAKTFEDFDIPRDILAVCLGKSTYARCFSGDTKIALVDGSSPTFIEAIKLWETGEGLWGYSVDSSGMISVVELECPRYIGKDILLEITLDNGKVIKCTPDHNFMSRKGGLIAANQLSIGESLFPLYRTQNGGYETVYQPTNGLMSYTYRLADEWNIRNMIYNHVPGTHCHHEDENKANNNPWNICRKNSTEHIRFHNIDSNALKAAREIQEMVLARYPLAMDEFCENQRVKANAFWHNAKYKEQREKLLENRRKVSVETRLKMSSAQIERYKSLQSRVERAKLMEDAWRNSSESRRTQQREIARKINLRNDIDEEAVRAALKSAGTIRGAAKLLSVDRSAFRRFPEVLKEFNNHKVVSIRELPGEHEVYCLTSPETGFFALDVGVMVQNCGIVVNVTPLEPEWKGKVTVEISNTTPLPAKIYSMEGIMQVLFFRGDEVCDISYADKKGRYQSQTDITLPFVR